MWAVEALKEIGKELGKSDWNFEEDPCSNKSSWATPVQNSDDWPSSMNNVTCSCSFPDETYHVISMYAKLQTLIHSLFRLFIYCGFQILTDDIVSNIKNIWLVFTFI